MTAPLPFQRPEPTQEDSPAAQDKVVSQIKWDGQGRCWEYPIGDDSAPIRRRDLEAQAEAMNQQTRFIIDAPPSLAEFAMRQLIINIPALMALPEESERTVTATTAGTPIKFLMRRNKTGMSIKILEESK